MSPQPAALNETDLIVLQRLLAVVPGVGRYSSDSEFSEIKFCAAVLAQRFAPAVQPAVSDIKLVGVAA